MIICFTSDVDHKSGRVTKNGQVLAIRSARPMPPTSASAWCPGTGFCISPPPSRVFAT